MRISAARTCSSSSRRIRRPRILVELLMLIDAARRASATPDHRRDPLFRLRPRRPEGPAAGLDHRQAAWPTCSPRPESTGHWPSICTPRRFRAFSIFPPTTSTARVCSTTTSRSKGLDNLCVVSPDVGSIKISRAFASWLHIPLAIVDKRRPTANRAEVMNVIGDVEDKNVIMIDDMIDTGGTLTKAAAALKERGRQGRPRLLYARGAVGRRPEARRRIRPFRELLVSDTIDLLRQGSARQCQGADGGDLWSPRRSHVFPTRSHSPPCSRIIRSTFTRKKHRS